MSWSLIAEKVFHPDDLIEVVGSFSMGERDDTLWVRITQIGQDMPQPWSYGILSWRTSSGCELGSVKAYGNTESEVFRLGVGRAPSERSGVLTFEPRGFNLGWIKNGFPWTLRFECTSGVTGSTSQGFRVAANSLVNTSGGGLSLVRVNFP